MLQKSEAEINAKIDEWHDNGCLATGKRLGEYLGWTKEEWDAWLRNPPTTEELMALSNEEKHALLVRINRVVGIKPLHRLVAEPPDSFFERRRP